MSSAVPKAKNQIGIFSNVEIYGTAFSTALEGGHQMKITPISVGILTLLILLTTALPCFANDGLARKQSKYSVVETMDKLDAAIKEAGAKVWVRIDLKAAATKGETLRPHQLVIFGRGGALQPLLSANSVSGIDLPQKILVFEDQEGKVWMVYNTGKYVTERHAINGLSNIEEGIDKTVGSIIDNANK